MPCSRTSRRGNRPDIIRPELCSGLMNKEPAHEFYSGAGSVLLSAISPTNQGYSPGHDQVVEHNPQDNGHSHSCPVRPIAVAETSRHIALPEVLQDCPPACPFSLLRPRAPHHPYQQTSLRPHPPPHPNLRSQLNHRPHTSTRISVSIRTQLPAKNKYEALLILICPAR